MKTSNLYSNTINRYDEMIYRSRPVKFYEFISDKYNKVHIELFNDALSKYYNSLISKFINESFLFNSFKLIENTYDENISIFFDNFKQKYKSSNPNYVKKAINELSINEDKFLYELFNIINAYINSLKNILDIYNVIEEDVRNEFGNPILDIHNFLKYTDIDDFRIIFYNNAEYLKLESDVMISEEGHNDANALFRDLTDANNHEFLTYRYEYENENEDTLKLIEENLVVSENNDYLFLFENEHGTRIAYNIYGELILLLDGTKYNKESLLYNINYIDKYNQSLLKSIKDLALKLFKIDHRVIEIKNKEYWMPSSICIISRTYPYTKKVINLDKYWNNIQSKSDYEISNIKLTDYDVHDSEIIDLNYIRGVAKMRSRLNDMIFEVPFEYLNEKTEVSEDYSLDLIK